MVKSKRQASNEEEQETRRQASKCPGRAVGKHVIGKCDRAQTQVRRRARDRQMVEKREIHAGETRN